METVMIQGSIAFPESTIRKTIPGFRILAIRTLGTYPNTTTIGNAFLKIDTTASIATMNGSPTDNVTASEIPTMIPDGTPMILLPREYWGVGCRNYRVNAGPTVKI